MVGNLIMFYIYAHYTLDTNELFYIGKGAQARAFAKDGRNVYWKRIVAKHDYKVVYLKTHLSEELAFKYEKYFIKKLSPKANLTAGGSGGNTKIKYSLEERQLYREKCSNAKRQFWASIPKEQRCAVNKIKPGVYRLKKWNDSLSVAERKAIYGQGSRSRAKKILCVNTGIIYDNANAAASALGIKRAQYIQRVAHGERSHCFNYVFKYVTSELTDIASKNSNITLGV